MKRLLAAALVLAPLSAHAQRWTPDPGTRAYRLDIAEHNSRSGDRRVRVDYDLVVDRNGGIVAVIRAAGTLDSHGIVTPVAIDDACSAALHAGPGELARITLAPLSADAARSGLSGLDECTPADMFGPAGEIFRIAMIQLAPQFGLAQLNVPGDSRRFAAFTSHIDRRRMTLNLDTPGGTTSFASTEGGIATIDWTPDATTVRIVNRDAVPGIEIKGEGSSRFAMRLGIDRATGALVSADSVGDRTDVVLDVPNAPPFPMAFSREIAIRPRNP